MASGKPLAIDLYTGLHGWAEGLIAAGWRVIGFDIEDMSRKLGEPMPEGDFLLVIQDVLTLHGAQFKDAQLIVGSSPCQEFSYRAMPWKRAKALGPPELGMALFHAQFRIQREAIEAAGRHIPLVVENVRGAERWVGRARACYGSYALWGDVPALMPAPTHRRMKFPGSAAPRMWRDREVVRLDGGEEHAFHQRIQNDAFVTASSGSYARKRASAKIAKIPFTLAEWIGRTWLPTAREAA